MHGLNSMGVTEYSHRSGGRLSADWLRVNVRSPTVMVAVRVLVSLFLSTA